MAEDAEDPIGEKVAHVIRARQTRNHTCHWTGCTKQVPPAMWGCKEHWFKLPANLRRAIWKAYTIGQERGDARVSPEYVAAARAAEEWIARNYT